MVCCVYDALVEMRDERGVASSERWRQEEIEECHRGLPFFSVLVNGLYCSSGFTGQEVGTADTGLSLCCF